MISVHLAPSITDQVNLSSLALPNLGPLSLSAGGTVNVTIGGSANINFGYDLTNPEAFLLGSTNFGLTAQVSAPSLNLSGTIGGVSVTSTDASITLADAAGTGPATVDIRASSDPAAWIPFSQISPTAFNSMSTVILMRHSLWRRPH